jgi:hypothetical protein
LQIPKRKSKAVNGRRTDNAMAKIAKWKRQPMVHKTLHRRIRIMVFNDTEKTTDFAELV